MSFVESAHALTYTWTIHNYKYFAVKKSKYLYSPKFEVKFVKYVKFYLKVKRVRGTEYVSFYLCKDRCCFDDVLCKLSIRKSNGQLHSQNAIEFNGLDLTCGFQRFVANAELGGPDHLVQDLTLSCRIWNRDANNPVSISRFANTIVKITEINYTLEIDNVLTSYNRTRKINQNFNISSYSPELPNSDISVSNKDDTGYIVFAIQCITNKSFFIVYTVNILHSNGNRSRPVKGQRLFDHSLGKQSFAFPLIPTRRLIANRHLYLKNNTLTICCHFLISTNEYEGVHFPKVDCALKRSLEKSDSEQQAGLFSSFLSEDDRGSPNQIEQRLSKKLKQGEHIWIKGWTRIVKEREFSDLIIRTPRKQFSVHKAVLSSHSDVFIAMLKHDMKEQNSGVIDIDDLEDDTIDKMLQYLYRGRVGDMNFSMVKKLYLAADKYAIVALLNLCLTYIESHLDTSNVCHILVLADTCQDKQLKSCAEDFIVEHASEIIDSEDWGKIMETHLQLSAIIMKRIISKNLTAKSDKK